MTKHKAAYQIINHGPEHSDYFQGCGTAFTPFKYCVTGIGDNAREAYDDALDQASTIDDLAFAQLPVRPKGIRKSNKLTKKEMESDGFYWHVSIRFGKDE